jgi:hypothetical protein
MGKAFHNLIFVIFVGREKGWWGDEIRELVSQSFTLETASKSLETKQKKYVKAFARV